MVFQLSKYLSDMFLKSDLIEKEEIEYYVYALEIMIEKAATYLIILAIAVQFKKIIPTFIFMICFFSLRKYTGGYHMSTYFRCLLGTIMTYALFNKFGHLFFQNNIEILYIGLIISVICILGIGAVNHPNMEWEKEELAENKKIARTLVLIEVVCIFCGVILQMNTDCIIFSAFAVILCAVLLTISKITKQEV